MARYSHRKPAPVTSTADEASRTARINQNFSHLFSFFSDRMEVFLAVTAGVSQTLAAVKSENYIVLAVPLSDPGEEPPWVTKLTASFTVNASATATYDCLVIGV